MTAAATALSVMGSVDVLPERPYPGLRAFRQDEWSIFFGREEHADEVIGRLGHHRLVLVHGASGCGKSSLVRAGVLPTLETNHEVAARTWRTATMRPSEGLLSRLAEILQSALPLPAADGDNEGEIVPEAPGWADLVVKGGGLVDYVEAAIRRTGGGSFCLLVDQFEEVFRWAREHSEAEVRLFIEFLKSVGANGDQSGFFVILTMRSDYFGECASYDGFAEFLNPRQYLLPRMDEFGLLRAIHEPAELYGGTVDTALSTMLLPEVKAQVDGLPVLQHALMRASDRARERSGPDQPWHVTADDLVHVGGAEAALAQHAEEILTRATGGEPELLEASEWIFRALTDLDADRRAIRRPCRLSDLVDVSGVSRERACAILDAFRAPDCTFIGPYLPEAIGDEDELDISHEALIRQWPRLSNAGIDPKTSRPTGWVYRELHDGLVWRSLAIQSEEFARNPKHLLSVATTEQRLPWFHMIEKRRRWTERHALTQGRHDRVSAEKQWQDVKAMMEESERNMAREKNIVARLKRSRNITIGLAVVALGATGAWLKQTNDTIREQSLSFDTLQQVGGRLIDGNCSRAFPDGGTQYTDCGRQLRSEMIEDYYFHLNAARHSQVAPVLDALPTWNQFGSPGTAPAEKSEENRQ